MKTLRFFLFLLCLTLGAFGTRVAQAAAPVFATPALTVNKTSTYVLDTVTYTIKLDNTAGTADALDVNFTDHLPAGIEVQLFSLDGVPQLLTLLTDGLYVGTIPAGTSRTVTISGLVTGLPAPPDPASYVNQASWTYRYRPTPGAPKVNASFTTNSVTDTAVRLETSMALVNIVLIPGVSSQTTYTLTVSNTGTQNSSGTTLTNLIPVLALYSGGSTKLNGVTLPDLGLVGPFVLGAPINSPGQPAGEIDVGKTATISFQVTSLLVPTVNVAAVDADGPGPILPLNYRGFGTTQSADLAITNTDGVTSVSPGGNVTYTIGVKNIGTATLDSIRVVDNLPLGLQDPVWTASTGTYTSSSGDWTGLTLATGQTITLTLQANVSPLALTNIVNTATVSLPSGSGITDPVSANNSATDTDTLTVVADLGVTQADGVTLITAGAPLTYTITVSNAGPAAVSSLTVTDTLNAFLTSPTFTPDEGSYNSTTGAWTGLSLLPGSTVKMTLSGTVSPAAVGTMANTLVVAPSLGIVDGNALNNTSVDTNTIVPAATVAGTVYLDANHNGSKETGESGTGITGLFVKLVPTLGTTASAAAPVNAGTGAYQFATALPGTYNLILDDNGTLTDITPALPSGYFGTEAPAQRRDNLLVVITNLADQNFGLWRGAQVSGSLWNDNGAGGATANDSVRSGGEAGIAGATVKATAGATLVDSATTDGSGAYTLWIPFGSANPIQITPTLPTGTFAIGGTVGTTGGTYTRASNTISFNFTSGTSYTGTGFAAVTANTLSNSAVQSVVPGGVAFFAHTYVANSAGTVTFTTSQTNTPAISGWSSIVYLDINGNGAIDGADAPITTLHLNAGQSVAVIVRFSVPADAPPSAQSQSVLSASFQYDTATPTLISTLTASDSAVVGSSSRLQLVQTVDKAQAKSGQIITYTIAYRNGSTATINNVGIRNLTPAFTTFVGAAFGTLPTGLTSCTITKPTVGTAGNIAWDFVGSLPPGGNGTVTFQVQVQ